MATKKAPKSNEVVSTTPEPQGKVKLIYIVEGRYSGYETDGRYFECGKGQEVDLTPEKAEQLLTDFPGKWRKV
jgi:hypothetical protein